MNTLSDEEFEQIYGRKPVRRVKKKKIYWNRCDIIKKMPYKECAA